MKKLCLIVGSALGLYARGGTSDSAYCLQSRPADTSANGSSTKPAVNGCTQSGKESLLDLLELPDVRSMRPLGLDFRIYIHILRSRNMICPSFHISFTTAALPENRPAATQEYVHVFDADRRLLDSLYCSVCSHDQAKRTCSHHVCRRSTVNDAFPLSNLC